METEKGIVRSKFIPPEAFFKSLIVVSESRSIESFVNHKWAETDHSRYITSTSAELFWGRRLCSFYTFNLNRSSLVFFFFLIVLCCVRTSLDGFRRTSPTPPPLLRPWLNTVTMHMSKESHVRSLSSITTAEGCTVMEAMKTQQSCHFVSKLLCFTCVKCTLYRERRGFNHN